MNLKELKEQQEQIQARIEVAEKVFFGNPCRKTAKALSDLKNGVLAEVEKAIYNHPETVAERKAEQKRRNERFLNDIARMSAEMSILRALDDGRISESVALGMIAENDRKFNQKFNQ